MLNYAVSSDRLKHLVDVCFKAAHQLKVTNSLIGACVYGSQVSGYSSEKSDLDALLAVKNFKPIIKYHYLRDQSPTIAALVTDAKFLQEDAQNGSLGEFVAGRFLTPFFVVHGNDFIQKVEADFKERVVLELSKNLVLEHKHAATSLRLRPHYFLYEKLRRRAAIYPPARYSYAKILSPILRETNEKIMLKGFQMACQHLCEEEMFQRQGDMFSVTEEFVTNTLKERNILTRSIEEIERAIKMYVTHGFAGRMNPRIIMEEAYSKARRSISTTHEELPEPSRHLFMTTAQGLQAIGDQWDVSEFAKNVYSVEQSQIKLAKIGGMLNATFLLEIAVGESTEKVFVKKFLNWSDLKWVAARLWTATIKNFSVLASNRMSNEIFFVNKLAELGFRTPQIKHVNWQKKIIFQDFVEGVNLLEVWRSESSQDKAEEAAREVGEELGRIHRNDICMGDCKPENFVISASGDTFLTDLEQAQIRGDKAWDLAEVLLFMGHYVGGERIKAYARSLIEGYLETVDASALTGAKDIKYLALLLPWTPVWVQKKVVEVIDTYIRAA